MGGLKRRSLAGGRDVASGKQKGRGSLVGVPRPRGAISGVVHTGSGSRGGAPAAAIPRLAIAAASVDVCFVVANRVRENSAAAWANTAPPATLLLCQLNPHAASPSGGGEHAYAGESTAAPFVTTPFVTTPLSTTPFFATPSVTTPSVETPCVERRVWLSIRGHLLSSARVPVDQDACDHCAGRLQGRPGTGQAIYRRLRRAR